MEIKELKGKLEVIKHLENQDDAAVKKKMQVMKEELEEKVEELESLETLNQALITKERRSNDEVQDARKALITGLSDKMTGESQIGIKRMGELESMIFLKVCKERFSPMEAEVEASTLYSLWQENLKNPEWHPFRAIGEEGHEQEIINKGDEKLQNLKKEWGDELHDCVVTALKELNEYNASGQYVVSKRRKESHIEGGNQLYHEEH